MSQENEQLPPRLEEIVEDFQYCEGREKLELLLQYAENMSPLPDWLLEQRDQMEPVHECMTPVFITATTNDHHMTFYFDVPQESPTVRGFAALMSEGLQGATPQEVLNVPENFFARMGLDGVLTMRRLNGLGAILAHMKRLAAQAVEE